MKPGKVLLVPMGMVAALLLLSSSAHAQLMGNEYELILLDQTGSMNQPGIALGDGTNSSTFFDSGISAAQAWIGKEDVMTASSTARGYAIWTFKDDHCCGGGQGGPLKIWPRNAADCVTGSAFEATSGFCVFAKTSTPYGRFAGVLDSLRPASSGVAGSGDPNKLLSTIPGGTGGATFDPSFGLGPNTPLASSFCQTVDNLQLLSSNTPKIFLMETDGGENFSAGFCSGAPATVIPSAGQPFPKATPDWGFGPQSAWQVNVLRRITRLISLPPTPITGTIPPVADPAGADEGAAIAAGPIKSPVAGGTDDVPSALSFRIDVHFGICGEPTTQVDVAPCPTTVATAAFSANTAFLSPQPASGEMGSHPGIAALAAAPAATAAVTTTPTRTISDGDLAFFHGLGTVNARSSFRQVIRDPAVKFGTNHKLAGDVDDSGCTDRADFNIVTQQGVYFQRAVLPLEIATRADLNKDGWVNRQDAQIVLDNWGRGCINPPGTKPTIP